MKNRFLRVFALIVLGGWLLSPAVYAYEVDKTSSGNEIKCPIANMIYYVNASGGPEDSLSSIQAAMQTWTNVNTSSFSFIYGGTTTSTDYAVNDGTNTIMFGPMDDNATLGENYAWYSVASGMVFDSDIKINSNNPLSTYGSSIAYDLQTIVLHELGHSLRLKDLYGPGDYGKVMYHTIALGEMRRVLHQDDIDGITHLYPYASSPCSYAILPSSQSFSSSGGTGSVNIVTKGTCVWSAIGNDFWITVISVDHGSGDGTITYSVSANTGADMRAGTITVAGYTFNIIQSGIQNLTVMKSGSGTGTVTSTPLGINCGVDCVEIYPPSMMVTLTAVPDENHLFSGWSGACMGLSPACDVRMDSEKRVVADFTKKIPLKTVKGDIDGNGRVDLEDAIAACQVMSGFPGVHVAVTENTDINGNRKIGIEKVIYILQYLSGFRNNAPVLYPIGNKSIDENSTLFFSVFAADPDGDALWYPPFNLPEGAIFDSGTSSFIWTPAYSQSGSYYTTFRVLDIHDASSISETITITVHDKKPVFVLDDYYPLHLGNWWEYRDVATGEIRRDTVTGTKSIGGILTTLVSSSDGKADYLKIDATGLTAYGEYAATQIYTGDIIYDPPALLMSNNAQIGTSITSSTTYAFPYAGSFIHIDVTATTTILGLEDVVTNNAMTLKDCVKITDEASQTIRESGQKVVSTETLWFYRGVGIVKIVQSAPSGKSEIITTSYVNEVQRNY